MRTKILAAAMAAALSLSTQTSAEVMTGAFVPGNAWNQQAIADLNANLPKSMAFINVFSSFSANWDHLYWQSSKIVNEGMVPLISWMPVDLSRSNDNLLPEIALGSWDSYIDLWGTKLVAWVNSYPIENRPSVMLRFGHEFNGTWYPYGNSPSWYVAAWQHIHDRFEAAGVNEHIEWVWSANNVNVDSVNDMTQYYPGDSYVDWTSIDGYNWGSNFSWSSWDSFNDVFASAYSTLVTNYPEKPILIAETGSAEPHDIPDPSWGQNGDNSDAGEDKDVWTANMMSSIENDFPAIRALALFNINKELDWSLTESGNTGLQGYIGGMLSSHFTSDLLSADGGSGGVVSLQIENDLQPLQGSYVTEIAMGPSPLFIAAARKSSLVKDKPELQAAIDKYKAANAAIAEQASRVEALKASGSKAEVKKARIELAKMRSAQKARLQRLKNESLKLKLTGIDKAKLKKIRAEHQRLRAASKPLPTVNVTKQQRMRDGFKGMSAEQMAKFRGLKMEVLDN